MAIDKASEAYWNRLWDESSLPAPTNPYGHGLKNYYYRRFHAFFEQVFRANPTPQKCLLEIGCAQSITLPYFSKYFGFEVSGLDRSSVGCEQARRILERERVSGQVYCGDLFSPPQCLVGAYDVVVSFGVAEHFQDTTACIAAFSQFLRPGGLIITNIPNMVGWVGRLQAVLNRPVFDIHVLLDKLALSKAHELSGLEVVSCDYFLFTNFGVANLLGIRPHSLPWFVKKSFLVLLTRLSMGVWFLEDRIRPFRPNRFTSPYINCVARKPPPPCT